MQIIYKYTKPDPSALWRHEESPELAAEHEYGANWFNSRLREDLGESLVIEYGDMTAQFTLTILDETRADLILSEMAADSRLQELYINTAKYAKRLNFEQLTNTRDQPDVFVNSYDLLVASGLITD